jgi:hypothetical protein
VGAVPDLAWVDDSPERIGGDFVADVERFCCEKQGGGLQKIAFSSIPSGTLIVEMPKYLWGHFSV